MDKLLTSKEYNTIAVKLLTDCMYEYNQKEYDLILDKLFIMTIKDLDKVLIAVSYTHLTLPTNVKV